jgi:tellurite resistance protein
MISRRTPNSRRWHPVKMPERVRRIIDQCKDNEERLCKSFRMKNNGQVEISYLLEPSGQPVTVKTAEEAIKTGLLVASNDGLFDAASSQSWRAA